MRSNKELVKENENLQRQLREKNLRINECSKSLQSFKHHFNLDNIKDQHLKEELEMIIYRLCIK